MATDVKSLTQIISDFRKLQSKDSVSPESLGAILQRIADLLATAGTSDTIPTIQILLNGFKAAQISVAVINGTLAQPSSYRVRRQLRPLWTFTTDV